jgi:hypothetical protein
MEAEHFSVSPHSLPSSFLLLVPCVRVCVCGGDDDESG